MCSNNELQRSVFPALLSVSTKNNLQLRLTLTNEQFSILMVNKSRNYL